MVVIRALVANSVLYVALAVVQLVGALRYKQEGRGFVSPFHWHNSSRRTKRNEYQEYFLGIKAAGAKLWQPFHFHVPIIMKSGSLKIQETSESVQALTGIALPFT
jgi:hypothetical protein